MAMATNREIRRLVAECFSVDAAGDDGLYDTITIHPVAPALEQLSSKRQIEYFWKMYRRAQRNPADWRQRFPVLMLRQRDHSFFS